MNNENKQYLTVKEVKEYLNVSSATAYELTHRSDFPVCRFGANIRVPRDAFWRGSQNAHLSRPASGHREEVLRL